uniref:Uncharacterized protein n=1 Tax=viral metagenome TaxID=1070528 RepID=A0A6C0B0V6_9ZZZZ
MFNQKVNGTISQNPDYVNYSYGAPQVSAREIHNCGTTINKFKKANSCASLPLQTWCQPEVAVASFAMRPIVNPKEYFENINKYLASIIYTDSINLKASGLSQEHYSLYPDYGYEPESSFIQAIKLEVSNKLDFYMSASADQVTMFTNLNPLCEGFIITDMELTVYRSQQNPNHFFHRILFSAFNTTRYNTVSFKAEAYQDTTPIMEQWNNAVKDVSLSENTPKNINTNSIVYVSLITLLNNTTCVTGQEDACGFKGFNLKSSFQQLLNDKFLSPPRDIMWEQPNSISLNVYNSNGNYDNDGNIQIIDNGPSNIDQIISQFKPI